MKGDCCRPANPPNQPVNNVKSYLFPLLAAVAMPALTATSFAGESRPAPRRAPTPPPAPTTTVNMGQAHNPTKTTILLDNYGQVIAVLPATSR